MPKAKPAETPAVEILEPEIPVNKSSRNKKAIEKHTVTTEWKEVKRIDAPPAKARKPAPVVEVEDDDDVDEDDLDELDEVLSEYGNGPTGLMMEISRLPNYDVDGRTDPMARSYITERPFDRTTFLQDLSVFCARPTETNVFLIRLKRDKKLIERGTLGPFRVEPASAEDKAKYGIKVAPEPTPASLTVTQAIPLNAAPMPAPQSVTERIAEVAQIFGMFKEMGLVQKQNPAPVQQVVAQPQNSDPKLELARYVMETPELAKQAIGNLIGSEAATAKAGVTEMIVSGAIDLAQSLMPTVGPALANFFNARAQAEQMRAYQLQQQLNGLPAAPSLPEQAAPQQIPEPVTPQPEPQQEQLPPQPEDVLFAQVLTACQRRQIVKPEVAAANITRFVDAHTDQASGFNPFDSAIEIFLSNEPRTILDFAAMQNPIAARMAQEPDTEGWLKALQDELRKELSGDESDSQQVG